MRKFNTIKYTIAIIDADPMIIPKSIKISKIKLWGYCSNKKLFIGGKSPKIGLDVIFDNDSL